MSEVATECYPLAGTAWAGRAAAAATSALCRVWPGSRVAVSRPGRFRVNRYRAVKASRGKEQQIGRQGVRGRDGGSVGGEYQLGHCLGILKLVDVSVAPHSHRPP